MSDHVKDKVVLALEAAAGQGNLVLPNPEELCYATLCKVNQNEVSRDLTSETEFMSRYTGYMYRDHIVPP